MVLYNDRVFAWERMQRLDKVLESDLSTDNISRMVADDERNHLAFLELDSYNRTGEFLYKHPILQSHKMQNDLEALRKSNPDRFMAELVNADKNITRYQSMLRNKKYKDEEELTRWQKHIEVCNAKLKIMQQLISQ